MPDNEPNSASTTLGVIAIVIGGLAVFFGWIPFLGLLAIPFAVIGGLLAVIGLIIALTKSGAGAMLPIIGGVICAVGVVMPIAMTTRVSSEISEKWDEVSRDLEQRRVEREREKAAYIAEQLELYEVAVTREDPARAPSVVFKLRNKGQRALSRVEVTFYFKDADGGVIAEESYLPVDEPQFSRESKPLKPGYVWQMAQDKIYPASSVPSEWKEGAFEAKITDIEFSARS